MHIHWDIAGTRYQETGGSSGVRFLRRGSLGASAHMSERPGKLAGILYIIKELCGIHRKKIIKCVDKPERMYYHVNRTNIRSHIGKAGMFLQERIKENRQDGEYQ